jgi:hypothetical protein
VPRLKLAPSIPQCSGLTTCFEIGERDEEPAISHLDAKRPEKPYL